MNLRVDLIMENEKRSANVLNTKSIIRIGSIIVPIWIAVSVAVSVVTLITVKNKEKRLKTKWEHTEPRKAASLEARLKRRKINTILNELNGWKASHIDWHVQLNNIQRQVPRGIKFDDLMISQVLAADEKSVASRTFTMQINGQAAGSRSEENLQLFERRIIAMPVFAEQMTKVDMQGWASTLPDASKEDREFKIKCDYKPRIMEPPKK